MHKILLIADTSFFLQGFQLYFDKLSRFALETATTANDAMSQITTSFPDIVVLDTRMNDGAGSQIWQHIRENFSDVPLLLLISHINPEQAIEAMRLGVKGIALKDSHPDRTVDAIDKILGGGFWFESKVTEPALQYSVNRPGRLTGSDDLLSKREREIVDFVCLGLRNRQIAEQCSLTEGTVKIHLNSIFRKLGIASRAELIVNRDLIRTQKSKILGEESSPQKV